MYYADGHQPDLCGQSASQAHKSDISSAPLENEELQGHRSCNISRNPNTMN